MSFISNFSLKILQDAAQNAAEATLSVGACCILIFRRFSAHETRLNVAQSHFVRKSRIAVQNPVPAESRQAHKNHFLISPQPRKLQAGNIEHKESVNDFTKPFGTDTKSQEA